VDQATLDALQKVPLFKGFHDEELNALARACVPWDFKAGDQIIKQGDIGHEFFVIVQGQATVHASSGSSDAPKKVATLKAGDYFGEKALMHNEPRSASIFAEGELKTLSITQESFRDKGLINKVHFAHRKAIGGVGHGEDKAHVRCEKTPEQRTFIINALKENVNLQACGQLTDQQLNDMVDIAWKEDIAAGTNIIKEGDIDADFFYVVDNGKFHIFKEDAKEGLGSSPSGKLKHSSSTLTYSERGGSFGEMALFFLAPRSASVQAIEDGTVWVFDRYNFKRILMKVSTDKLEEYMKYLKKVQILQSLLEEEMRAVAQALVEIHYTKDEVVFTEGQNGNCFYILFDGEVTVSEKGKEVNRLAASRKSQKASTFGEKALLDNEKRTATLTVSSKSAKMLALDRESFDLLLGPLEEVIRQNAAAGYGRGSLLSSAAAATKRGSMQLIEEAKTKQSHLAFGDLRKLGLLGCGGFGFVFLYEHKTTKESYALKGLSKGYIVKTGMQESAINEKNILMMADSPFIIKLHQTFNEGEYLYFLLEPALGGELYAVYSKRGFHGSEKHAKFYVAAMLCAFEHLHARRIIYRDLKPENIMLKHTGQAKLTDMGLAKYVIGKTYTTCGTPDYFAPELVQSVGYTSAIDWWSLGILLFELMTGYAPFEARDTPGTYQKILKGINVVQFPPKVRGPVQYLIKALLKDDPSDRLPCKPGGTKNVTDEKWYEGFDWNKFRACKMAPPYMPPSSKGGKDLSNFDASPEDMPPQLPYQDDGSGWDKTF